MSTVAAAHQATRPRPRATLRMPSQWKMLQIRMPETLKTAIRIYCSIVGKTETAYVNGLIIADLKKRAPDLLRRVQGGAGMDDFLLGEDAEE